MSLSLARSNSASVPSTRPQSAQSGNTHKLVLYTKGSLVYAKRLEPQDMMDPVVRHDDVVNVEYQPKQLSHLHNTSGSKMLGLRVASAQGFRFSCVVILLQVIFILIFRYASDYGLDANSRLASLPATGSSASAANPSVNVYPFFQDIQGMMFIGFAFLMTFLKKYGFGSVAYNLLICGLGIQWALIMNGMREIRDGKFAIDVNSLVNAEFAIAAVLISFGAVLGKLSVLQLSIMTICELPIIAWNEHIGRHIFHAVDVGDSIFIHMFGAYFGLAVSAIASRRGVRESANEGSVYHSDLFSMLGTLVLMIYWPSFNSASAVGDGQARAIVNTTCAIFASIVLTFAISALVPDDHYEVSQASQKRVVVFSGRFNMVHIQNATLAGAVAVGASANLMIGIHGALIIGGLAGIISVLGYRFITPHLNEYIHDTCGVNNLHGMPGLLGGFAGAVGAALATLEIYGTSLYLVYPVMAAPGNWPVNSKFTGVTTISDGANRTSHAQGGYQLAAMAVTLVLAIGGGVVTGLLLRFVPWLDMPEDDQAYDDESAWQLPETCVESMTTHSQDSSPRERVSVGLKASPEVVVINKRLDTYFN